MFHDYAYLDMMEGDLSAELLVFHTRGYTEQTAYWLQTLLQEKLLYPGKSVSFE